MSGLPSATAGIFKRSRPTGWAPPPFQVSQSQTAAVAALAAPSIEPWSLEASQATHLPLIKSSSSFGVPGFSQAQIAALPPPSLAPPEPTELHVLRREAWPLGLRPAQIAALPAPSVPPPASASPDLVGHKRHHEETLSPSDSPVEVVAVDAPVLYDAFDQEDAVAELAPPTDGDLDPADFEPVVFFDLDASDDEPDIGLPADRAAPHWAHGTGTPPNSNDGGAGAADAPIGGAALGVAPPAPAPVGDLSPDELARRGWSTYCIQEPVKLTVCPFLLVLALVNCP